MSNNSDPELAIQKIIAAKQAAIEDHAIFRESIPFKAAIGRVDRLLADYGIALDAINFTATRSPALFDRLITLRVKQQFVESIVSACHAIKEGLHNPARRELRFLLEASIKTLWLDAGSRASSLGKGNVGIQCSVD